MATQIESYRDFLQLDKKPEQRSEAGLHAAFSSVFPISSYSGSTGRAYGARFLWLWPNARISVMGGEQAANVLWTVNQGGPSPMPQESEEPFKRPILEKYERESDPYFATARLWDDGIVDPPETRNVLGLALSAALNAPPPAAPRYGVFRM